MAEREPRWYGGEVAMVNLSCGLKVNKVRVVSGNIDVP